MVKKTEPEEAPIITENKPKSKGASKERMIELNKMAVEAKKVNKTIKKFDKENEKKEMLKKYEYIKKLEENQNVEVEEVEEEIKKEEQNAVEELPKQKKEKRVKVVEKIIEVEESSSEEEEEEIVYKEIIKKIPKKKKEKSTEELYMLSNTEMLKQRLYQDRYKRVQSSLFDY